MPRLRKKVHDKIIRYKLVWHRFSHMMFGNSPNYLFFVDDKKFINYVKNSIEVKGMYSRFNRFKFIRHLKYPGTLGIYLYRENTIAINLSRIYYYHPSDYTEQLIETVIHETLHYLFYRFIGHYVNKQQEDIIMRMGYYSNRKKMKSKKRK